MILADKFSQQAFKKGKLLFAVSLFLFMASCSLPAVEKLEGSTMGTQFYLSVRTAEAVPKQEELQQ